MRHTIFLVAAVAGGLALPAATSAQQRDTTHKPLTVGQVGKNVEKESKRVANRTGKAVRKAGKQTEKQAKRTARQVKRATKPEKRSDTTAAPRP
jgi:uncharacterized membrane protein